MGAPTRRAIVEALVQDLRRASFTVHASFRRVLFERGVSMGQFIVLRSVVAAGHGTANELARSMGVTTGNITGLVDKLELGGLVVRRRSATDRRVIRLVPTKRGRGLVDELRQAVIDEVARSFSAWSVQDLQQLERSLRRVIESRPCDC